MGLSVPNNVLPNQIDVLLSRYPYKSFSDMYSSEDFERPFIRYKNEAYPKDMNIRLEKNQLNFSFISGVPPIMQGGCQNWIY